MLLPLLPSPPPPYLPAMHVARLSSRAVVRVSGPDARAFLHGLLTQDVESLAPGALRFGALLTPQGRMLFDLFLWGEAKGVVLDVAADRRAALMQRLGLYRLRAQVEIAADDRPVLAAWPEAPAGFVADPRLAALGGRALGEVAMPDTDEAAYQAHRLSLGVPDPALDLDETSYPIDGGLDRLNGIDFGKGCFIGQETTSRMKRRGEIKKRMLPITFDGPPPVPGAEVLNGELRAGEVRTGFDGTAIALLRLDRLEGDLTVDGRPVRVRTPAWLEG